MNPEYLKQLHFSEHRHLDNPNVEAPESTLRKDVAGGLLMITSLLISIYIVLTLVLDAAKFIIVRLLFLVPVIFLLTASPSHADGGVSGAIGAAISAMSPTSTAPDSTSQSDDDD